MDNICKRCEEEHFTPQHRAITIGLRIFKCFDCEEKSGTYAGGQYTLCHACSEKMQSCVYCGKEIKK